MKNISEINIELLENIILKIIGFGIGGIIMATHVYLKLAYPDWLIIGIISTIIGFILIMAHY